MKKVIIITILMMIIIESQGQLTIFQNTYSFNNLNLEAQKIVKLNDKGFLLMGMSFSYDTGAVPIENYYNGTYLVRTDQNGDTLWTKFFSSIWSCNISDAFEYSDNSIIITGSVYSYDKCDGTFSSTPMSDFFLFKISLSGDSIWFKKYPMDCSQYVTGTYKLPDGSLMMCISDAHEQSALMNPIHKFYIYKINQTGVIIQTRSFKQFVKSYYGGFIFDNNNFYFLGLKKVNNYKNILLIKTNNNGDTIWTKVIIDTLNIYKTIKLLKINNNFIIAGPSVIYKTDLQGNLIWKKIIKIDLHDITNSLNNGFLAISNSSNNNKINVTYINTNSDSILTQVYGNSNPNVASNIIMLENNNFVGLGIQDYYNLQINPSKLFLFSDTIPSFLSSINYLNSEINNNLLVYPNPSDGSFYIQFKLSGKENVGIEIINLIGETIFNEHFYETTDIFRKQIKLNILDGIYILNIQTNKYFFAKRLIITNNK